MSEGIEAIFWVVLLFVGVTGFYILVSYALPIWQLLGAAGVVVCCLFVFAMLPLLFGIWYMATHGLQTIGLYFFVTGFIGVFADAGFLLWCLKNKRAFAPNGGKPIE